MINIIGLGPGNAGDLTLAAFEKLKSSDAVYLRTRIHPTVDELEAQGFQFISFDHLYESAASFDEVYSQIAGVIVAAAKTKNVTYAVPGHPLIGEKSVELIISKSRQEGIPFEIIGGISFIEPVLEAVGCSFTFGLKILDALTPEITPDPNVPNIVYQVYDRFIASDIKLALLEIYRADFQIAIIRSAGIKERQKTIWVPLCELDHGDNFDHLTTIFIPQAF